MPYDTNVSCCARGSAEAYSVAFIGRALEEVLPSEDEVKDVLHQAAQECLYHLGEWDTLLEFIIPESSQSGSRGMEGMAGSMLHAIACVP